MGFGPVVEDRDELVNDPAALVLQTLTQEREEWGSDVVFVKAVDDDHRPLLDGDFAFGSAE